MIISIKPCRMKIYQFILILFYATVVFPVVLRECVTPSYMLFFVAGVPNRHYICPGVDRHSFAVQQHHEVADSHQQHGWTHMDSRHHLPQLQTCRSSLDHHSQPASAHIKRWEDPVHVEVNVLGLFLDYMLDSSS